ncbi:MAG: alpha/beta hydrolase family protein [Capsulimonas sp.]|uniref:alpha/beta hydrolase n=1 Tax=Capsulimonas sp. TaxID=2494211 RepID=UPI003267CA06
MAVCEIQFNADNALERMVSVNVILPETGDGPFPVYYLLHGLSDNHTAWQRYTSVERYAASLPIIIVMPDGDRSFYTDSALKPKDKYETFITHDLIKRVDTLFRTIPTREGRAIGGLSMGGYGAVKLALKHPDLYSAAVSHSGVLGMMTRSLNGDPAWTKEFSDLFGADAAGSSNDVRTLAEKSDPATRPPLWIDCGTEDFLFDQNEEMHAYFTQLGVPHEYFTMPGDHNWEFWDQQVRVSLPWIAKHLGIG